MSNNVPMWRQKCKIPGCSKKVGKHGSHGMCTAHARKEWGRQTGYSEKMKEQAKARRKRSRYGEAVKHPLYNTWLSMKGRCYNENNKAYKNYGGRGIKVCDRWLGRRGFWNFVDDIGERPIGVEKSGLSKYSLDRIDVNGDYCPENCRWSDRVTQNLNRRDNLQEPYISTRQRGGRTQYVVRVKDLRFPNGVKVRTKVRTSLSLAMAARDELLAEMRKMGAR